MRLRSSIGAALAVAALLLLHLGSAGGAVGAATEVAPPAGRAGPPLFYGLVLERGTGAPVDDVYVEAVEADPPSWRPATSYGAGWTDADGSYRVDAQRGAVPAGVEVILRVNSGERHPTAYSGGGFRASRATSYRIVSGQSRRVDVRLAPCLSVTMPLTSAGGTPDLGYNSLAHLYWERTDERLDAAFVVTRFRPRTYSPCVPPGRFTVRFHVSPNELTGVAGDTWAPGVPTQERAAILTARPGPGATRWPATTFRPGGEIAGRVTDEAGRPVKGAVVSATGESVHWLIDPYPSILTDADGRYRLAGLTPGRHVVFVAPYGSRTELAAVWSGNANSPGEAEPVAVSSGRTTTYSVRLKAGARIGGRVVGGPELDRYPAVGIYSEEGAFMNYGRMDAQRRFWTPALPPGRYRLAVGPLGWHSGAPTSERVRLVTVGTQDRTITLRLPAAGG